MLIYIHTMYIYSGHGFNNYHPITSFATITNRSFFGTSYDIFFPVSLAVIK
jgi:hypothetical protein